ncbi:MAG TPA: SDR family oxidoreductase [Acidimicrobiales bacterium]|jgi:NAD(P)-dependent dehydrogenase (short-subunit alcohol dehydrogenase family)|nr:SDR family oxidoreductase [Acidimicrobiales bacterium]
MTVVVTGATEGIGRGVVDVLAARGVAVAALARGAASVDWPDGVRGYACDVASPDSVADVAAAVVSDFGSVDGLVNSAGLLRMALPSSPGGEGELDDQWRVNFHGTVSMCRALLPALRAARGTIVNVSSSTVFRPIARMAAYGATKAAVEAYSQGLALEVAADGVRVHVVRPGLVRSNIHYANGSSEAAYEAFLAEAVARIPLGRVGEPLDVAGPIAFLLSDGARWMTGSVLTVDGGRSLA